MASRFASDYFGNEDYHKVADQPDYNQDLLQKIVRNYEEESFEDPDKGAQVLRSQLAI